MSHTKWNYQMVHDEFDKRSCYLLETEYKNSSVPMRYIASCGHEHKITFNNFLNGKGNLCKKCRIESNAKKESRLNKDELIKDLEENGCSIISYPLKWHEKFEYTAQCSHKNLIDYAHWVKGAGRVCSSCSKSVKYSDDFVKSVFSSYGCELLEKYTNCKTPIKYRTPQGKVVTTTFDTFLNGRNKRDRDSGIPPWREFVFARDDYTCSVCCQRGNRLEAHHLESYADNIPERLNVENGITLCKKCHRDFHKANGFGKNTKVQFDNWKREYRGKYGVNNP